MQRYSMNFRDDFLSSWKPVFYSDDLSRLLKILVCLTGIPEGYLVYDHQEKVSYTTFKYAPDHWLFWSQKEGETCKLYGFWTRT